MSRFLRLATIILFLFLVCLPRPVNADDRFITVVNPIRISAYNSNPVGSLMAQYGVIKRYGLPAPWLLTYDALNNRNLVDVVRRMDQLQEPGLFFEVSPEFAKDSGVEYHQTGSWHFANAVFLSGYTQEERLRLIDTLFVKFKSAFDHYPTSVGAWWIDSFSLQYMRSKYGITANLVCADQYLTDNYQIWGMYWSIPFYPSLLHAGIPAQTLENKIGVVSLQWAARDPSKGYFNSRYSTQDYLTMGLNTSYFNELLNTYPQVTVGLESDLLASSYDGEFNNQMLQVYKSKLIKTNMAGFSSWYISKYPNASPPQLVEVDNAVWYQSPYYRIGVDKSSNKIIDLRVYPQNYVEPYYSWINGERELRIYVPSVIDSLQNPREAWSFGPGSINFEPDYFEIPVGNPVPKNILFSKYLNLSEKGRRIKVSIKKDWPFSNDSLIRTDWSLDTVHLLKSPKTIFKLILSGHLPVLNKEKYIISQGETEALERLRWLPFGKIMVYDHECLQCTISGPYKPLAEANYRGYVSEFSKKSIIYNSKVFESSNRVAARSSFVATGASYIYLVKYGSYIEKLPISPGDLGVELFFENANAQIWVRKS